MVMWKMKKWILNNANIVTCIRLRKSIISETENCKAWVYFIFTLNRHTQFLCLKKNLAAKLRHVFFARMNMFLKFVAFVDRKQKLCACLKKTTQNLWSSDSKWHTIIMCADNFPDAVHLSSCTPAIRIHKYQYCTWTWIMQQWVGCTFRRAVWRRKANLGPRRGSIKMRIWWFSKLHKRVEWLTFACDYDSFAASP